MWLLNNFGAGQTSSGRHVTTSNALTSSSYYACVRNLSEDVGTLPIDLYRKRPDGGRDTVTNKTLSRLLTIAPNQYMTSTVYRQAMMFAVVTWGNAYSEIVRNFRGQVIQLNFIHPSRVSVRKDSGVIWYEVTGEIDGTAVSHRLEFDDMLHIKGPSEDGIIGLTIIQLIAQSVGVALSEQDFNGEFYQNGAVISGVLSHPKTLQVEAQERLRESWKKFSGTGKRHKPLVLEEDMTWTPMGIPPRDAQFIESRHFTVTELARWFRMPPHKIMHLEDATYSNIESQDRQYVTDTLMPWMLRIEQEMNMKLLTEGEVANGLYVEHNAEGRLRGDTVARAAFYRALFNMASISPNEIREKENMNPIEEEEGNSHFMQINLAPIDELPGANDGSQIPDSDEDDDDDEGDDDDGPVPPEGDDDGDQATISILVQDAVNRTCRRAAKMKPHPLDNQDQSAKHQVYLESALDPILMAFGKQLAENSQAPGADDYKDPFALHKLIMENLEDA
jgi:HK97 family phage portal protein